MCRALKMYIGGGKEGIVGTIALGAGQEVNPVRHDVLTQNHRRKEAGEEGRTLGADFAGVLKQRALGEVHVLQLE